jgi:hypothetical protein
MQTASTASRFCFVTLAFVIAALGQAQVNGGIIIEGISDKQVANRPARIRVSQTGIAPAEHRLDGQRIPAGVWIDVTAPGYHELHSVERPLGQAGENTRLVRFVIQSARGQAEWALPPWTPLPPIASGEALEANAGNTTRLELFMPIRFPAGLPVPVVAMVMDAQARRVNFTGPLKGSNGIGLKRGVGSGLLPVDETKTIPFHAGPLSAENTITIDNDAWQAVEGDIKKTTTWKPDTRVHVTSSLNIAKGATLIIRSGCVVKLAPKVEVTVHGRLIVDGAKTAPIVFCPESPDTPWGGVTLRGATAAVEANWAFVTGSGGNPWWFLANSVPGTHRNEQAAFFLGEKAAGAFSDCFFINNAGQAFHGEDARLTLDRCVVQRCQTVGQFNGGSVAIRDSVLLDFPNDDSTFADGDNDALYFTLGKHEVIGTLIGWCKDDGIDAGGDSPGTVTVSGCWIESCFHEGLALSGTDKIVRVRDTVILNCGQAVEAGYLSPNVSLERCLLTGNGVGARFGDNYAGGHIGLLTMSASLSIFNRRDVWGLSRDRWAEKISRMKIDGNHLSRLHDSFPDNQPWASADHAALLTPFLFDSPFVPGVGFREWDRPIAPRRITVGLSRPSTKQVQVRFNIRVEKQNGEASDVIASGVVEYQPGETAKDLSLEIPGITETDAFRVELSGAVNGELMGPTAVRFQLQKAAAPQTWIAEKSAQWKWLKGVKEASEPSDAWKTRSFDDGPWPSGSAPFGYGREGVQTALADMRDNYTTVYLRHEFALGQVDAADVLRFAATYDDGFALWINGQELARVGLPLGELPHNGRASESDFAPREWSDVFPAASIPSLAPGKNIVAVHIFNTRPDSTDLFFDLSLTASQSEDADADNLPDAWEQRMVRAKTDDSMSGIGDILPSDDFDEDGLANRWELAANTDPVNPFSTIRLEAKRSQDGTALLQWQAKPHRAYQLQHKRRLATGAPWETVQQFQPVFAPAGETRATRLNPLQPDSGFFRLRLVVDE